MKNKASTFIQWKGTDLCMDFYCICGEQCHFDGYFAYAVQCPYCERVYEMPQDIKPKLVEESEWEPIVLEKDESRL